MPRPFREVDVFGAGPYAGNPVAVVHDADGLSDAAMQRFAHWTNLSETTFLLPPTTGDADYRVRIFTPGRELPFAGHPTLGTCHAWLEAGGGPRPGGGILHGGGGPPPRRRHRPGVRGRARADPAGGRPAGVRGAAADPVGPGRRRDGRAPV